ncbi:MAG: hypothetical protein WC260_04365 [Candidatus Pacearchaeota archaeon]
MKVSKRPWNAFADADRAVRTVKAIYIETGTIPEPFKDSYMETLPKGKPRVVERFYALLAQECPEALKYFIGGETYGDINPDKEQSKKPE